MNIQAFLDELRTASAYDGQIVAHHRVPPRPARTAPLDPPLPPVLARALRAQEIDELYTHQVEAITHARARRDVVVVTGTASGKTLCYNLPVIERLLEHKQTRALYLYPLKALARDQLRKLEAFGLWRQVRCGAYDGDTPAGERRTIRDLAQIVLSNPDMLHVGILPRAQHWAEFLSRLEYVVIDEVHMYRGVFGSHAAHVLRRLLRLCERYGSRPTFIASSATIANPGELAEQLTGRRFEVVTDDGAPRGAKHLVVWNPPVQDARTGLRRSGNLEATWLLSELVQRDVRSLAFAPARQEAELVLRYLRAALEATEPARVRQVAAYRAGYLPEDRRRIEGQLSSGELRAVISTVALEAGIDIGGLDAVVLVGYPGTVAGFWQQAGRAGRGRRESLAVLVTRASLIDQFFAAHPETLWQAPTEQALVDPDNIYILGSHLLCAAYEQPLDAADLARFGPRAELLLPIFAEEGILEPRGDRWFYVSPIYPAGTVSLRATGANGYELLDTTTGQVLGVEDPARLWDECFPGAVHLHEGEQYLVQEVDETKRQVRLEPVSVGWYTNPTIAVQVVVDETTAEHDLPDGTLGLGELTVTKTTVGYRRIKLPGMDILGIHDVDCPPQSIETSGLWLSPAAEVVGFLEAHGTNVLAALHAAEHALAGALPLLAMCDPRDIQGASTILHPDLGVPALFVFDQYPGGIGLSERGFEAGDALLRRAHDVVANCPCRTGCPACVQSPYCGANNQPLDKLGGLVILRAALGLEWRLEPGPDD